MPATTNPPAGSDGSNSNKRRWNGRSRGGFLGNWILLQTIRLFGIRAAYLLLFPIASYFVLIMGKARRASLGFLRHIYPKAGLGASFRHFFIFGQVLLDRFAINFHPEKLRLEQEGLDNIQQALAQGHGLILLSAHMGAWESAARLLGERGPVVNVVMFRGEEAAIQKMVDKAQSGKINIIAVTGTSQDSFAISAALARGEIVALHGDRTFAGQGVKIPFLGQEASFPSGPFVVAATSGAPIIYTFSARLGVWHYRMVASVPQFFKFTNRSRRQADLREWIGGYVSDLEKWARQYPFQWFNFFDFWQE